jgi:hypothetical protein
MIENLQEEVKKMKDSNEKKLNKLHSFFSSIYSLHNIKQLELLIISIKSKYLERTKNYSFSPVFFFNLILKD